MLLWREKIPDTWLPKVRGDLAAVLHTRAASVPEPADPADPEDSSESEAVPAEGAEK